MKLIKKFKKYIRKGFRYITSIPLPKVKPPKVNIPIPQIQIRSKYKRGFKKTATIFRDIISATVITSGSVGLLISYVNPLPLINKYYTTTPLVNDNVALLYANVETAVWVSIGLISFGLLLHVNNFKAWKRNIRAFPRAVIKSPKRMYRKLVVFRDWLLETCNRLNEESAKWHRMFSVLRSPYSLLRGLGFSPQMAVALLTVGSTATTGVVVNETILADRSFSRGDSGVYAASVIGNEAPLDIPTSYSEKENTLRIDLGATPVREITIENVTVGTAYTNSTLPQGETNVVQISGNPNAENFTPTRLEVGELIFEKNRCKKLTLSDINAHTILVEGNASDGQSIAPSPGTARMRAIGGGHHQAEAMITSGGTYDRIWIQAPSSGVNGKVGTLKLSNLFTKGGDCVLSKMDIGTLTVKLNEIGNGDGFATKDFTIATSVTGANLSITDNVEVSISEPATQ